MARSRGPHMLTVDWLGGPIRMCTAYRRDTEPRILMAWEPLDKRMTAEQRVSMDRKLRAKVDSL